MWQEWKRFRSDEPGQRFQNHRARMKRKSRWHSLVALVVGVVLIAVGIVFLFIPGPGSLGIAFGLALVGTHWERLARYLDRGELALRRWGHHAKRRWKVMHREAKASMLLGATALAAAGGLAMWHFVVSRFV